MLTPEIVELCKQASVEQDGDRLLYLVSEINRLIAVRDDEHRKPFAFTSVPESEDQSQILKSHPCAEGELDYTPGIESR
jgi:hypothetical protein